MCRRDSMVKRSSRASPCVIALIEISDEAVRSSAAIGRISTPTGQSWLSTVWPHDVTKDADRWSWMENEVCPKWLSVIQSKRERMIGTALEKLCAHDWPTGLFQAKAEAVRARRSLDDW